MVERSKLVEVTRSYTRKLNTGNYTSQDFFCSQKLECLPSEAKKASREAIAFCKAEVLRDITEYKANIKVAKAKQRPNRVYDDDVPFYDDVPF